MSEGVVSEAVAVNSADAQPRADYGWTEQRRSPSAEVLNPIVDEIMAGVPAGARVLDVGCGRGDQATRLAEKGFRVVGIDPAASGVDLARRRCPKGRFEVTEADETLLDRLGEAPFDVVISTEVCEHVYDPYAWARACRGAMAPDGLLIASTPYHGYLKNLCVSLLDHWDRHWTPLWVGGHIKFWSRKTLGRLLTETGFTGLSFRYGGRMPLLWKTMVVTARGT